ncbi:MAG: retropepsin-like aspartic protease [Bacteroidia bacterium]
MNRTPIGNKWMTPVINHFEQYKNKVVAIYKSEKIVAVGDSYLSVRTEVKQHFKEIYEEVAYMRIPENFLQPRLLGLRMRTLREEIWDPEYAVWIQNVAGDWIKYEMLVDSGADFTFISREVGEDLGLELQGTDIIRTVYGVGGAGIQYTMKQLNLKIADTEFLCEVAWCLIADIPDLLLGRLNVFHTFKVTFDQRNTQIIFEPYENQ